MASSQLLWQLVKNNHCFLHKGLHGAQFSSEPGNLYNVNSYKYSGAMRALCYLLFMAMHHAFGAVLLLGARSIQHLPGSKTLSYTTGCMGYTCKFSMRPCVERREVACRFGE